MAKARYPSPRMFKSDFCERFSHVHPATPAILFVPVVLYLLWYTFARLDIAFPVVLGLGVIAYLAWGFTEYVLHRFIFHFPFPGEWGAKVHRLVHGIHHEDPNDPTRLVMPPFVSILLTWPFFRLFEVTLGPVYAVPFMAFFILGYLSYDYTHFYIHHARPKTWIGKAIKQSHMNHHYVAPNSRWGVSSPLWDVVFGTLQQTKQPIHADVPELAAEQRELATERAQQGSPVA
jgi:sterol desaturase/sphingolipid hydroxylase (fatty acid hydroxylase superfamily)